MSLSRPARAILVLLALPLLAACYFETADTTAMHEPAVEIAIETYSDAYPAGFYGNPENSGGVHLRWTARGLYISGNMIDDVVTALVPTDYEIEGQPLYLAYAEQKNGLQETTGHFYYPIVLLEDQAFGLISFSTNQIASSLSVVYGFLDSATWQVIPMTWRYE